jgi:formylmethanofuran dehydrogenase subunit E
MDAARHQPIGGWLAVRAGCATLLLALACRDGHHQGHHPPAPPAAEGSTGALARVAEIHGAAGPFAVAGYRIGERALRELGAARGSFDLEVKHETPPQVQWSCIADGLQAATGTSAGKLNLRVVEVSADASRTVVRNRRTGRALRFELTPGFLNRFLDLPREKGQHAGQEVLGLRDQDIFQVTPL